KDFGIDVTGDMQKLASITLEAEKTGGIILGGGISKHHAIGVNILRDGFNYAVYFTTSTPWDGSLSGAQTNEAVSWGKIREKANHVTVYGDVSITFPLTYYLLKR
ncbi:MAG: deoxyhypusine synthase family protein, partial [Candidatus Bilamarchaeaceae archaeon]